MDPIDAISSFADRSSFIDRLLASIDKLSQKEAQIVRKHKYQLNYVLSLYEIIEATKNRTNFEVNYRLCSTLEEVSLRGILS